MDAKFTALTAYDGNLRILNLSRTCLVAYLGYGFGNVEHAADVCLREEPAMGIHRQLAANLDPAVLDKCPTFPLLAETIVLEGNQHHRREAIIELCDIYGLGGQASHSERLS